MSQTHSTRWSLVWRALVAAVVLFACDGQDGGSGIDVEEPPDTTGNEVLDVSFPDTSVVDTADASDDAEPDTGPPCPGCFGAPCETNSQCNSGYCVPGPDGSVCTQTCVESCPTDWSCRPLSTGGGDPVFLCLYDHLSHCAPCRQDSDCVDPLNPFGRVRCLEGDAEGRERFCASPCQTDGDCPAGNTCGQSDEGRFCAPVSGVCECSPWAALTGAETDCINSNDFGICAGVRRCGADGLSTCLGPQAAEEVCNGVDDDCDGQEDESFPDQGLACDGDDEDLCDDDVLTCFDGSLVCVDAGGAPNIEVCDGADNDCDGFIDADDQDLVRVACDVVAGVCEGAQRPAELCVEGVWLACDNQHYEAHSGSFEAGEESRCDGFDNDCDGVADEDFHFVDGDDQTVSGVGSTCGVGGCAGGVTLCNDAGTGLVCSTDGLVQAERCNGVDDDCDGLVDTFDSNLLTSTCENQEGVCLGSTKLASLCIDGIWAGCVTANYALHADTYETDAELSCDALDNDCDGRTDEDFDITMPDGQVALVGASCGTGLCAGGVAQCNAAFPERGLVCTTASNSRPEVCNGLDDDCDGLTDDADPDLARPLCEEQRGVCTGARKPASLCGAVTAGEWASCTVTEYRAHAASHNPTELACDGFDNDCDGRVDEDFALAMPDGATVTGVGASCGVGGCAGGILRCAADGASVECSSLGSVQAEVCDNVDNDCDGRVDALDSDLVRVQCGTEEGVCIGAQALPDRCVDGAWQACGATDFAAHSELYAQVEARCDGVDEDCDGRIDDDFSIVLPSGVTVVGAHRNCGEGACTGGVTVCNAGGDGLVCDSGVLSSPEVCDGEDNDCDGLVDSDDPDMTRPRCEEQRGACNGARRPAALCVGGAWAACTATTYAAHDERYDDGAEVRCDGVDNDCDGASDEDFTVGGVDGVGRSCGVGACAGGVTVCNAAGNGTVCPGDTNTSTEVCDGIDNDCDGLVDGADSGLVLPLCENQNGVCATATKTPAMCVDGRFVACGDGDYLAHSELFEAGAETRCDGADNDCDGRFDEDFSLVDLTGATVTGAGTSCGAGVCAGGVAVCNGAGSGLVCSSHVAVSNEVCDGVDNDCDGRLDAVDASLVRVACSKQDGVCAGATSPASLCVDGNWQACTSDVYAAFDGRYQWPVEGACDGLDNDCDGAADDDFAYTQRDGRSVSGVGTACGVGNCEGGTLVCAPSGNGVTCPGEAAASGERCDGEDNDCDGFLDAVDTDMQVVPCERQDGVCANATKPPALCVAGAWTACGAVVYGAFSSSFEAGSEVSCDGLDNDCDGIFDEDFATTTPDGSVVVGVGASCGVGRCAGGVTTCNAGGNGTWCPSTTSIVAEACNGQDDDCDGRVDAADGDLVRVACDEQRGACAGAMRPAARCVSGAWQACLALDYTAHDARYDNAVEVRCDGVDNDCNGAVDEDFVFVDPGGQSSTVGGSCGRGLCAGGTTVCAAGGQALTCSTAVSAGGEICDGLDQDCDGVVDDGCDDDGDDYCDTGFAVLGRPEVCGLGGGDCNDGDAGIRPNANETCDNRDEDCDGGVDEAYVDCERARCEALGDGTFAARVTEGCAAGDCVPVTAVGCGLYACAGAVCASVCATDSDCASAAHCDERVGRCVADLDDGDRCLEATDCSSSYCGNGFCCSGGDCCAANGDCPASYDRAAVCDTSATCQGTRRDRVCEDNVCAIGAAVADDRACTAATLALDCAPAYVPVYCVGGANQTAPSCPSVCVNDASCLAGFHCDGSCLPNVVDGGVCDEGSDCASGYCNNGFCCSGGDCCAAPANCPASYRTSPSCGVGATCQGTRVDATCVSSVCGRSSPVDDDSACGPGVTANACGLYVSITCSGNSNQTPPTCPTSCTSDVECDTNAHCDGTCVLDVVAGGSCDETSDCASGYCANGFCCTGGDCCAAAGNCPASYTRAPSCDSTVTCQGTKDVAVCVGSVCGTTVAVNDDAACVAGTVSKLCGPYPAVVCAGGVNQSEPQCATGCTNDSQCDGNAYCRNGACVADEPDGGSCEDDGECESSHCRGGICCSGGDCCRSPSDCRSDLYAEVPSCENTGTCQGGRKDPVCVSNVCNVGPRVDDDSGCGGVEANLCGPYPSAFCTSALAQGSPVCASGCSGQSDCDVGAYCAVDGTCRPDQSAGGSCATNVECANGLTCVDGVCCTSSCAGGCRRCDLSGNGTCTFVGSGLDPDDECSGVECTGYHYGFIGDMCYYKDAVSDAEASCNGAGACQSRDLLCRAEPDVGFESPVGCDDNCQEPVGGTCNGTVPGACTNLNLGNVTCGLGICTRTIARCTSGAENTCVPGPSSAEICNGFDDDCDGITDSSDGDLLTNDLRLCDKQLGVCSGSDKPAGLCVSGQWGTCGDAVYEAHDERYEATREVTCDGTDNDCDGVFDEDFAMVGLDGRAFTGVGKSCGTGRCSGGVTACAGGSGISCPTETLATTEICNGSDDDCDGVMDVADADLVRVACEEQRGVCAGSVKPLGLCGAGGWGACGAPAYVAHSVDYSAGSESRCDAKDNDCNGSTDEDFTFTGPGGQVVVGAGLPCGLGRCGGGVTVCNGTGTGLVCSTSGQAVAEVCNGVDDDCDGLVDAADPGMTVPNCENQAGACAGAKKPLALCGGVTGWAACGAADYAAAGQPNATHFQSGLETRCDGRDNDCNGQTDEDFSVTLKNGTPVSGIGQSCGVGSCSGGTTQCNAGGTGIVCPSEANATAELCDGVDNDCDGLLDAADSAAEVSGGIVLPLCDKTLGVCSGKRRVATECVGGNWQSCAVARYGGDYQAGLETRCDALDNDCDGDADEDFVHVGLSGAVVSGGVGESCGVGRCGGGTTVCNGSANGVICSTENRAVAEVCGRSDLTTSSFDDDCDGLTDGADITVFPSCSDQDGECAGSRQIQWQDCSNGVWAACSSSDYSSTAGRIYQATETACDLRDNDCNGTTDGTDTVGDGPLHSVQFGVCSGTRQACTNGGWFDSYPATYGTFELPNDVPASGTVDENCDNIDGTVNAALFASPTGSGTACSRASPCTLTYALTVTDAAKTHIYLRAGDYSGIANITRAFQIYGGYDTNWVRGPRTDGSYRARLTSADQWSNQFMTVRVVGASTASRVGSNDVPVRLRELDIIGPTASGTLGSGYGKSSYALYTSYAYLDLWRVGVTAGAGAPGLDGAAGSSATQTPAGAGGTGGAADRFNSACNTGRSGGGGGATNGSCSAANAGGGGQSGQMDQSCGWTGVCSNCDASNGLGGGNAAVFGSGFSTGGGGGGTCGSQPPGGGVAGRQVNGAAGAGASDGFGFLSSGFFAALSGGSGGLGDHGSGGGGGGGSGACDDGTDTRGAGGGGGGAGGCRSGTAGSGAQGGGGSFAVFSFESFVTANNVAITRALGGAGGGGGAGAFGQPGGSGGSGGAAATNVFAGGRGGNGGHGGHSGGGGGGAGGPSFGVWWYAATSGTTGNFTNGAGNSLGGASNLGGAGGAGGARADNGAAGSAGPQGSSGEVRRCNGTADCGP